MHKTRHSLNVKKRMLRCSVTEYLKISGSTTNSTRQPIKHSFNVLNAILSEHKGTTT